jgi:predicted nucleic acid-binding protein
VKVIDANVALKWYVPETDSDVASAILLEPDVLVAPQIIKFEVLSVLVRFARSGRLEHHAAEQSCNRWLAHLEERGVMLFDEDDLLESAISLGLKLKHHLFDCFYLALAKKLDAPLITFDEELAKKAKQAGLKFELLAE